MKCSEIQFILPLYSDDAASAEGSRLITAHIDTCPVCRQKLADLHEIRAELRGVGKPRMVQADRDRLRKAVVKAADTRASGRMFRPVAERRRWIDVWLMPSAIGVLTTLVVGFSLLWLIVSREVQVREGGDGVASGSERTVPFLYPYSPTDASDLPDAREYAGSRLAWSKESPSLNPRGSLVELASRFATEVKDDEVTVIADVHANGSATIARVIEPEAGSRAIRDLQKALNELRASPFVPADMDERAESTTVVLKIQNVNVNAGTE